jgi:hypothetical protein
MVNILLESLTGAPKGETPHIQVAPLAEGSRTTGSYERYSGTYYDFSMKQLKELINTKITMNHLMWQFFNDSGCGDVIKLNTVSSTAGSDHFFGDPPDVEDQKLTSRYRVAQFVVFCVPDADYSFTAATKYKYLHLKTSNEKILFIYRGKSKN